MFRTCQRGLTSTVVRASPWTTPTTSPP